MTMYCGCAKRPAEGSKLIRLARTVQSLNFLDTVINVSLHNYGQSTDREEQPLLKSEIDAFTELPHPK